jgi:outer membrane receptor for monomeric catechols
MSRWKMPGLNMNNMKMFDEIYVRDTKTKELVNITELPREKYEYFLELMHQLRIGYSIAIQKQDRNART